MVTLAPTLSTFTVDVSGSVSSVELLGSWDNFTRPYSLSRDSIRGPGHWRGCFTFDRIVCDGTTFNWNKPRSGALLQGGRYWYYYRIDDRDEIYSTTHPSTLDCPLLPGQCVNVLEVPVELGLSTISSANASIRLSRDDCFMTLNPEDRYNKRKEVSSIMSRRKSLLKLLRPRNANHEVIDIDLGSPEPDNYQRPSGRNVPLGHQQQDLSAAPSMMATYSAPTQSLPLPPVMPAAAADGPRHVRAKPSLKRMASDYFKSHWTRGNTSVDILPPLPSPCFATNEMHSPGAVDSVISPRQLSPVKPPVKSEQSLPDLHVRRPIRQTTSVRNLAQSFKTRSRSGLMGRRSKSHAVLNVGSEIQMDAAPPCLQAGETQWNIDLAPFSATDSEMCSPSFTVETFSDSGSHTPSHFSAQYAITSLPTGEPFSFEPEKEVFDMPINSVERIPRTWITDLESLHIDTPQPATHVPDAPDLHVNAIYGPGGDEDDWSILSRYDKVTSLEIDDYDSEQDRQDRLKAVAALRATLMADDNLVTINESQLADLAFLREAIV